MSYIHLVRYCWTYIRRRPWDTFRGIGYLVVLACALVCFAALMPSLEYQHVEALEQATWDVWMSGPVNEDAIRTIGSVPDSQIAARILTVGADRVDSPLHRSDEMFAITLLGYGSTEDLANGPVPEGLMLEGRLPHDDGWACDWSVAHGLHVGPGDRLSVTLCLPDGERTLEGVLTGVYGPSGQARNSIAIPRGALKAVLSEHLGDVEWTDLYLNTSDPASVSTRLSEDDDLAVEFTTYPLATLATDAQDRLIAETNPFLRSSATWIAAAAFACLALLQQGARARRRRKERAILYSIGAPRVWLHGTGVIEHVLLLGVASCLGLSGAIWLMQTLSSTFVPPNVLTAAILLCIVVVAASSVLGVLNLEWMLRRQPTADLLRRAE